MAAQQQGGGGADNSNSILWGVAALFATIGAIWFFFKNQIVYTYIMIKLFELNILNSLTNHKFDDAHNLILLALSNANKITFPDLVLIGDIVGRYIRLPLALLMIVLAFVVYFGNSTRIFKKTYSMKDLAKLERDNWPQITPVLGLDLIKTDIDVGPWAMAMTPMQFCKRHKLLEEIRPQRREGMSRKDWDRIEVILKKGEANRIFVMQLGSPWRGTKNLPPHARALFAVFAARINADSKAAADLLRQLNMTCSSRLDYNGVDALLAKHEKTKLVKEIVESHAYVSTVMAAMLKGSRDDGVQASSDFLWLKPLDRRLWYTLNTVGRQTPFAEVAGIFAHWMAEREAGRKLIVPMVEEATKALEVALKEVVYKPDEEEEK